MHRLPFAAPGRFLRGNLHTHSDRSDGALPPAEVVARYRANGYDFLAITDHLSERHGWRITEVDDLGSSDFCLLRGAELHGPALANGELWHVLAVGLPQDFPSGEGETPAASGPELARRALAAGAWVAAAHPAWYGATADDILGLGPVHAVEVHNATCAVANDRAESWPIYQQLLDGGARFDAYAADDAHFHVPDDAFRAWVMVKAERNEAAAILAALKAGRYYSSTGPQIHDLRWADGALQLSCSPVERVLLTGVGKHAVTAFGSNLSRASLRPGKKLGGLLRLTVVDALGRRAWTNPFEIGASTWGSPDPKHEEASAQPC